MVSLGGQSGASLYHKLRDGCKEALAIEECGYNPLLEHHVTFRRTDRDSYILDKIETNRSQYKSQYTVDWNQLAVEARCPWRTVTPPPYLYIRGHSKFEGQKLATIHSTHSQARHKKGNRHCINHGNMHALPVYQSSTYVAKKVYASKAGLSKVCVCILC